VFTGAVPHQRVYNLISAMDIAMMADSNWYGSPVKIFEYGALGKAVIAPNTEPVLDVMKNMQDGILCKNNIPDILSAMSQLQEDEMLRAQLAVAWQEKVLKYYNWRVVSQNIIEQIRMLKTT
ncbi:MAG: glycosyltransferase, partial [Flavobacteriales bacterium]|nr:glycosyltransferase [Flavobacteriales bacterium]